MEQGPGMVGPAAARHVVGVPVASLRVDHDGYLMVDFRWQGVRCREYLGRKDTKENRGDARRLVRRIDGEIAGGTFDYLKYFPDGRKKHLFARETAETGVVPPFEPSPESGSGTRRPGSRLAPSTTGNGSSRAS